MVLNSQLETKMEQNTQAFCNLLPETLYLKKNVWITGCFFPLFIGVFGEHQVF